MSCKTWEEAIEKCSEPFPSKYIQWRIGRSGFNAKSGVWAMGLAYLDSRAVMDRLDAVFGMNGWSNHIQIVDKGVLQTIVVTIDGVTMSKSDGAQYTDFEEFKGGISDAFKRAAVLLGIGRYLYDLEENFLEISTDRPTGKCHKDKVKNTEGKEIWFYWKEPELPKWALPKDEQSTVQKKADKPNPEEPSEVWLDKSDANKKFGAFIDELRAKNSSMSQDLVDSIITEGVSDVLANTFSNHLLANKGISLSNLTKITDAISKKIKDVR